MFQCKFCIVITNILVSQHADDAQQAFSSGSRPSLHNALPAIETLYAAWQNASTKPRYAPFVPALEAAMAKLDEYYKRTAESDAHIIAMGLHFHIYFYITLIPLYVALDPRKKFAHFKKNWDPTLQEEVKELVNKKVRIGSWIN
jgi:hypothetical protein